MTDFETWILDHRGEVLRMLEYRRPGDWTPYEMERKFSDESRYVSVYYQYIIIKEAIELPDKDILIGYSEYYDGEDLGIIKYKKLSQIELAYYPSDNIKESDYEQSTEESK